MRKFQKPTAELIRFRAADVVATSGPKKDKAANTPKEAKASSEEMCALY